jgi:G8 domain
MSGVCTAWRLWSPSSVLALWSALLCALLLAGCSGSGDNDKDTASQAAASEAAEAPPSERALALDAKLTSDGNTNVVITPVPPIPPGSWAWSNPATWGGRVPQLGEKVRIPAGKRVVLDVSPPRLAGLSIEGQLSVAPGADLRLTADHIMVMGVGAELRAGTATAPFSGKLNIVLSGTDPSIDLMGHGTKVLMTHDGGTLALYGMRKRGYSRLAASITAGNNRLTLADDPTGWKVGDQIAVAPTDFEPLQAEKRRIIAIQRRTVFVDAPFNHAHWGRAPELQGGLLLDMRAHVANLTRNIRISSIDNESRLLPGFDPDARDASGQQNGRGKRVAPGRFGGHMAFMHDSFAQLDSVEITELGQQGVLGRYPAHWHLQGQASTGGNFMRHSSLHGSFQRGVVLHQTHGVKIEDNVLFDILGHAVYLEDGVEHHNVIDRNLVMLVRYVPRMHRLSLRDPERNRAEKLSGFWITNPANYVRDNIVAGVQNGWGFIFARVEDDKIPIIEPANRSWVGNRSYLGFSGNTAYAIGFMPGVPDGGDSVFNLGYGPEEAGSCFRFNIDGDAASSAPMSKLAAFKCANAAFWSTHFLPITHSVVADSRSAVVNNQGERGISQLQDSAIVGLTANNPATRTHLDFGPFTGPNLKEHLQAGPVTLDNVVTSGFLKESFDGLAPAMNAARSNTAGFRLRLPPYLAIKANSSQQLRLKIDRSGGYLGAVELAIGIPKPSNLADENPYYTLTADPLTLPAGATEAVITLRNGSAQRAGNSVVVLRAKGDATVLSTLRVLSATPAQSYLNAATGNNLARLIPGDTPRNPQMSSVVQNAAGRFAVDGNLNSWARFEGSPAPWIRLDFERSYTVGAVVIEWDPAYRPRGDLWLSLSDFEVLDGKTLAEVQALPADIASQFFIRDSGASRIELALPAGTTARQAKLWVVQEQAGEVRLREIAFVSR